MSSRMTLEELKRKQPALLSSLLADYSEESAIELANNILEELDDLERIEESYNGDRKKELESEMKRELKIKMRRIADLPIKR